MKSSKLFLTSLLAAAAMSATAYAESYTATGDVKGNSDGACVISGDGTITDSSGTTQTGNISLSAGDIVTFNAASGHLHGYRNDTFVADIVLGENATSGNYSGYALYIYRGEGGGKTQTFSGSVSGSGSMGFGGSEANVTTYIFTGNVTGLTGNINAESQTSGGLRFGLNGTTASAYSSAASASDGVILNISGTGSITTGNSLVYNYTGGANGETLSVNNTSLTAKTLTFGGGATYTVASTVSGKSTTASDNTLTISAGTTTFTGAVSNFGNVTVASGATLAVGATGSLNLSSANVTLASAIQNSGGVTVSNSTVFVLADALKDGGSDNTWNLITGNTTGITGWDTLTVSSFRKADGKYFSGRSTIDVNTAGSVTITDGAYSLFWKSGTTEWNSSTLFDKDSVGSGTTSTFEPYDNVTFSAGDVTVSVDSAVTAGTVNISAGTVMFTGEKVTAQDGFLIDGTGILKLDAADDILGTVTVNEGGKFELNGKAENLGENDISVVLNGGTLSNGGAVEDNKRQLYGLTLTADSTVEAGGRFGLVGAKYAAVTLDLGGHTLTKTGGAAFVLVNTTVKNGTLSVTEGSVTDYDNGDNRGISLIQGAGIDVSGSGSVNLKITSMEAGTSLTLNGTNASTVTLNGAIGANAVVNVSSGTLSGTITSVGDYAQLTLAGTGANAVTLNGAIGANAVVNVSSGTLSGAITTIEAGASLTLAGTPGASPVTISSTVGGTAKASISVSNGNCVNYNNANSGGLWADITISGVGSTFTQATGQDMLKVRQGLSISVSDGGTLALGAARWEICSTTINLDGGNITGTYNVTSSSNYGNLDFGLGGTTDTDNYKSETVYVTQTHGQDSTISASIRLRSGKTVTFDVAENATLNITGQLSAAGTFVKAGAGTVTFDMPSTPVTFAEAFTGAVNIEAGKVVVKNSAVFGKTTATTTRAITVKGNAALQINLAGGALDVGTTGVTFAAGSKFLIDLTGVSVEENTALTIISSSAISFNSISAGAMSSNDIEAYFDAGNSVLGDYSTWLREWSYDTTNGLQLTLTIPEPSVFGLLAGLGALALAGTRRRRKKA